MITVTTRLHVHQEKKEELRQALTGLAGILARSQGCIGHHVGQDIEKGNLLFIWESWSSRSALERYWRSDHFSALLGAAHLLAQPIELQVQTVSSTEGFSAVRNARREIR